MKVVRGKWKLPEIRLGSPPTVRYQVAFFLGASGGVYDCVDKIIFLMGGPTAPEKDWASLVSHEVNHWAHAVYGNIPKAVAEPLADYGLVFADV